MESTYVDAEILHNEIDSLDPVDMAKVMDFVGYLKSRSVRKPPHHKTEQERVAAIRSGFKALQESGAFSEIEDPVAWQREIRKDRPLPGREA